MRVQRFGSRASDARSASRMTRYSWLSSAAVVGHRAGELELAALVHEQGGVAAVVEDQVRAVDSPSRPPPVEDPLGAPPVLLERLALPGEHRHAGGASTVPFGPTATAAAASSWVEKMLQLAQRTCAPSATSVSMSTAVCTVMCSEPAMRAPFERLAVAELGAQGHEAGHLVLGEADLVASRFGEGEVAHGVVDAGGNVGLRHPAILPRGHRTSEDGRLRVTGASSRDG